jgi:hypothetical protein
MAKQPVNKSQAIRDALAAHPDKTPIELSEVLKAQGLKIPPTYISTIKSNMKAKGKRGRRKTSRANAAGGSSSHGLMAAVELVKASGGLEGAKAALKTVEQIARWGMGNG